MEEMLVLSVHALRFAAAALATVAGAGSVSGQGLVEIPTGVPGAKFVPVLSNAQRVTALAHLLKSSSPPVSGATTSLTPNAPYASDGSHLSFWKPSFVIGTADGGEAGINFWGKYQEGHMNVALRTGRTTQTLLDCRVVTTGHLAYKIYGGERGELRGEGEIMPDDNHAFLLLPGTGEALSVELWPAPQTQPLGILGCEISAVGDAKP
jgi:hypothetical protein